MKPRVIPTLLLSNDGLVKTVKFREPRYIGDPINAVRIFNEKEVDEMAFLDISATPAGRGPNFDLLTRIASEAFMPFGYGGGITSLDEIRRLFSLGVEKVIINSAAASNPALISEAAQIAGSSSIVVSVDARRKLLGGYGAFTGSGAKAVGKTPVALAKEMQERGAGEILLTSIDREGTMSGYDLDLVRQVTASVDIPVIVSGGAGVLQHFREAVDQGASAVAAGSMFVYHGRLKAVLITYPDYNTLDALFS
ncbi:MAG: AglZ/HisF2 family acetamidino modification protein [Gemmatimonadaceae bacterium]|nr:AglZ/HisF2 family acetamidino modification protein [Gemmatimonadaceae bacterium]